MELLCFKSTRIKFRKNNKNSNYNIEIRNKKTRKFFLIFSSFRLFIKQMANSRIYEIFITQR